MQNAPQTGHRLDSAVVQEQLPVSLWIDHAGEILPSIREREPVERVGKLGWSYGKCKVWIGKYF